MPLDLPPGLWVPQKPAIIRASRLPETPADARGIRMMPPLALGLGGSFASLLGSTALTSSFPVVEATNISSTSGSATQVVNLPAGISSGDLLLIFLGMQDGRTINTPSGWTQLYNNNSDPSAACFYKVASGSEGASVSVTLSSSSIGGHTSYRISNYQGTPEAATLNGPTSSANPNPPSLTPSWGSAKTLWITATHNRNPSADPSVSSYPANTTNGIYGHVTGAGMATAQRQLEASSWDPNTYTMSASVAWCANTVAIRPA